MASLVERILTAKQRDAEADTTEWKHEIDRHVHALYPPSSRMAGLRRTGGLTKDEIKLVEESAKR